VHAALAPEEEMLRALWAVSAVIAALLFTLTVSLLNEKSGLFLIPSAIVTGSIMVAYCIATFNDAICRRLPIVIILASLAPVTYVWSLSFLKSGDERLSIIWFYFGSAGTALLALFSLAPLAVAYQQHKAGRSLFYSRTSVIGIFWLGAAGLMIIGYIWRCVT
jgi:hypothetical protein